MKKLLLILLLPLLFTQCKKDPNPKPITPPIVVVEKHKLGEFYKGGIVFYLNDTSREHGLIVSKFDLDRFAQWGCSQLYFNNKTTLGSGKTNTEEIVKYCAISNIAAKLCDDYSIDGNSDWYLPSKDELMELYLYSHTIGGFTKQYYWSSSQYSDISTWCVDFTQGNVRYDVYNTNKLPVRAISSF